MNMNSERDSTVVNETIMQRVIKLVIVIFFVIGLTKLSVNYYADVEEKTNYVKNETQDDNINGKAIRIGVKDSTENIVIKRDITKQPSCPKSYLLVILYDICVDLKIKKERCGPEDFHKTSIDTNVKFTRKKLPNTEPKVSAFMNYVVGSLLITSLAAALMELYKAKKQGPKRSGKCPLSRKSSLADLTVMKHQRKELIRRESIMEMPEESSHTTQLGCNLSSLQRRCSFPVGQIISGLSANETMVTLQEATTVSSAENKKSSVSEDRRQSLQALQDRRLSTEYRVLFAEGKRFSIDDSPEKRRHRHLVHRH